MRMVYMLSIAAVLGSSSVDSGTDVAWCLCRVVQGVISTAFNACTRMVQ
jgi:hypothetical protein